MRTGTDLRSAVAISTGTARACACERAATPSVVQKPRTSTAMPIRASAAPPMSHFRLIIGNFRSGLMGPARTLPIPRILSPPALGPR